ncbi:MAG: PilT/PilU family type 4a pilus ATPase [Steroidobacteraceae bacterium]|nr:PilT/PilU family type 4a pilus ATPase [Deltaproteobacteria bacterium]
MHQDNTDNHDHRLGGLLLESSIITQEQLDIALKQQSHCEERIGSVMLRLGYLNTETLLEFLRRHFGTPSIDLYSIHIAPSVLNSLSFEQMKKLQALPIIPSTKGLFVGMADPNNIKAVNELEFILGRKVEPLVVPHAQIDAVFRYIEKRGGRLTTTLSGEEVEKEQSEGIMPGTFELKKLITLLMEKNASDLLISAGVAPCLKLNNEVIRLPGLSLTPAEVEQSAKELMTDPQWQEFMEKGELDFGLSRPTTGRFRVNAYRQRGSISLAIRNIDENIPTLASCGLPDWIEEFVMQPQGLILITGPTGHGKSTTLAALINLINSKRKCNIITIEDPIEFLHKHKMSNINQREIGRDTASFHEGLSHIFRQAPDVIMIGEMRDPESFEIAVQAAETGHLVISTMHANSTTTAIERIIEIFPPEKQQQIRVQLAEVFLLVMNQRLIPRTNGAGRVLAFEKLANTPRIRNMIRESKTHQIRAIFQHSAAAEYQPIDISLNNLIRRGDIALEEGIKYCENPAAFREMPVKRP